MRIKWRYKLLLAFTTVVFIVLLVQGILSGSMVLSMLEKRAEAALAREAGGKALIFSRLVRESEEDLTILGAHRENENYFTFRSFEESSGMVEALSNLELFFHRVHEVKPQYDTIQLLAANGASVVLQLSHGEVVHRFDDFDGDYTLRTLARQEGRPVHRVVQREEGARDLISLKPLVLNGQVEGYLLLRQSVRQAIAAVMRELAGAGITAVLRDGQGRPLAATPDYRPALDFWFQNEPAGGDWITVATKVAALPWTLVVGMTRSESFNVFRNLFISGLVAALVLVAVVFFFVRKAIQTLREYNRILEHQVALRTGQLAQANAEIQQLNESLKLENRRMGAELDVSRRIQQMVLPRPEELVAIETLEVVAFMEPATEVGGDYYDILCGQDGEVRIGIGDVTGHGLESGVVMLMVQSMVRTLITGAVTDAKQRLAILNRTLYENIQRLGSDKHLTLALLDYLPERPRKLRESGEVAGHLWISGQHESVIVVRHDGELLSIDTVDLGFPIALVDEVKDYVNETVVPIGVGDVVILYTDGITEAANERHELYGLERLCQVAVLHRHQSAAAIQQAVVDDVKRHIGGQVIFDDLTMIVMKPRQP